LCTHLLSKIRGNNKSACVFVTLICVYSCWETGWLLKYIWSEESGARANRKTFNTSQWGSGAARAEFSLHERKSCTRGALRTLKLLSFFWKPNSKARHPKQKLLAPRPRKIIHFFSALPNQVLESGLGRRGGAPNHSSVRRPLNSGDQFPRQQRRKKQTNYARSAKIGSEHSRYNKLYSGY
jgi:hypothetical protein